MPMGVEIQLRDKHAGFSVLAVLVSARCLMHDWRSGSVKNTVEFDTDESLSSVFLKCELVLWPVDVEPLWASTFLVFFFTSLHQNFCTI